MGKGQVGGKQSGSRYKMDYDATLRILKDRLSRAQQRNDAACARFSDALKDLACLPHPDGMTSFERAARSYRKALADLRTAQDEMAQFLLHSALPPDIQPTRLN